ncbi:MAG: hypothetical protein ACFCU6_00075 [Balneolaceae bacterium]
MGSKFKNLKNSLNDLEDEPGSDYLEKNPNSSGSKGDGFLRYVLFGAFLVTFLFYAANNIKFEITNPFQTISQIVSQPDEDLLQRMNIMMAEMGYTGLIHEELAELRRNGVTATYIASVRELGYTDLTLEDAVRLRQADASATFMAMMLELGYELDIDDFIRLRRNGVTASFTSNMHDLGYAHITVDELIRLRQIGVTSTLVRELQEREGQDISLDQIIRYRISNQ